MWIYYQSNLTSLPSSIDPLHLLYVVASATPPCISNEIEHHRPLERTCFRILSGISSYFSLGLNMQGRRIDSNFLFFFVHYALYNALAIVMGNISGGANHRIPKVSDTAAGAWWITCYIRKKNNMGGCTAADVTARFFQNLSIYYYSPSWWIVGRPLLSVIILYTRQKSFNIFQCLDLKSEDERGRHSAVLCRADEKWSSPAVSIAEHEERFKTITSPPKSYICKKKVERNEKENKPETSIFLMEITNVLRAPLHPFFFFTFVLLIFVS